MLIKCIILKYVLGVMIWQSYVDVLETQLKFAGAPPQVTTIPLHKAISELRNVALNITNKKEV